MNYLHTQAIVAEPMVGARVAALSLNLPLYYFTKPRCRDLKRIPHYRIGQMVRFRMSELTAWTAAQRGSADA
jgi:hypothetical protein